MNELASSLSPDLREELERLALPFDEDDVPSGAELRVAQAQLVGWLEGLFHGIQATLFAQQAAARQQLEHMQRAQQGSTDGAAESVRGSGSRRLPLSRAARDGRPAGTRTKSSDRDLAWGRSFCSIEVSK